MPPRSGWCCRHWCRPCRTAAGESTLHRKNATEPAGVAVPPWMSTTAESLTWDDAGADRDATSRDGCPGPVLRRRDRRRGAVTDRGDRLQDRVLVVRRVRVAGDRARDDVRERLAGVAAAEHGVGQVERGFAEEAVSAVLGVRHVAFSGTGAPRTRLGAVPDQVRRNRSLLPPCWSHRMMKSPACRLAHGLQLAIRWPCCPSSRRTRRGRVLHELEGDEAAAGLVVALPGEVEPVVAVGVAVGPQEGLTQVDLPVRVGLAERRHRVVVDDADLGRVGVERAELLDVALRVVERLVRVGAGNTCRGDGERRDCPGERIRSRDDGYRKRDGGDDGKPSSAPASGVPWLGPLSGLPDA